MATAAPNPVVTYRRAVQELESARSKTDTLQVREAAEKLWLAVVEATDRFLAERSVFTPQDQTAHSFRRHHLSDLGRDDWAERYSYLSTALHGDVFYFGENTGPSDVDRLFEKGALYIEEVTGEKGLRRPKRPAPDLMKDLRKE